MLITPLLPRALTACSPLFSNEVILHLDVIHARSFFGEAKVKPSPDLVFSPFAVSSMRLGSVLRSLDPSSSSAPLATPYAPNQGPPPLQMHPPPPRRGRNRRPSFTSYQSLNIKSL